MNEVTHTELYILLKHQTVNKHTKLNPLTHLNNYSDEKSTIYFQEIQNVF